MPQRKPDFFRLTLAPCLYMAAALALLPGKAVAAPITVTDAPVNFQAKQLTHDDKSQTVTAIGDVELVQGEKVLRADKMVYNLGTDTVQAVGNVSLLDEEGNVHFAEYVQLSQDMKNGFVQSLLSLLADGARFTAAEGRRENGTKTTMVDASYTACKVCETDPEPLWQLKADKVVHNAETHSIEYKNARLEFMGVPLAFSPIFAHADPTVKRKSGFLRPDYGFSSELGTFLQGGYYFGDIAPDKDATIQVKATTNKGALVQGQWRERFENGRLQIDASGARSDRKEEDGSTSEDRWRGHIFANGRFDLDEKWRAGFDVARSSDKEYLRLYDLSKQNVLNNEAFAERFSGRDYTRIAALNFQDVRLGDRPDQADVLPMMETRFIGEPDSMLGGRWSVGAGALGLRREASGQDVQRGSADLGWERRDIHPAGLVTQLSLQGRADFYSVHDSDAAKLDPSLESSANDMRGMAVATAIASYPLVRRLDTAQILLEPIVGLSASPQIDDDDLDIPNEDSIDTELDANNLFSDNRFPGIDRVEDGVRANYGINVGAYGDNGRHIRGFLGQSYRLQENRIFPEGSGLEKHASDVVGEISASISKYFSGDYRFQVDNDFAVRRHELQATGGNDRFGISTRYIYIDNIAGTGFDESREQLQFGGLYRLNRNWWATADTLTDLGEEPGLRKASFGINYADECFTFTAEGVRNLLNEASGDRGTVLMLRVGLRNIGEFSAPDIQLGQEGVQDDGGQ